MTGNKELWEWVCAQERSISLAEIMLAKEAIASAAIDRDEGTYAL